MIRFSVRSRRPRSVAIIPLIDVAMFLLIFFMVAGTIERFEILPVTPPPAHSSKWMDEGHIVILLGTHEEIVIGESLVTLPEMEQMVQGLLKDNPAKVITVKADGTIPAQRMLAVMDALKRAGASSLSIATRRPVESAP